MGDPLAYLEEELEALASRDLLRAPWGLASREGELNFCSNDYLGYAAEPLGEAARALPSGAAASRLVSGDSAAHRRAEEAIADWTGQEAALLFSSGYAANVGVLGALAGRDDLVVSDALNHASIIDGCRLSGARVVVVPHRDVGAVEFALRSSGARRRFVVTESYFSMDGDVAPLADLRRVCDAAGAVLMVDEAHALGVFGREGRGLLSEAGVRADVLVGTFGKSLGLSGAFAAGSSALRTWLWNRARSFVFSTGLSPAIAGAAAERIRRARADEVGRRKVAALGDRLRAGFASVGLPSASARGPVIPVVLGEAKRALEASRRLREAGIVVQAIRPPTVPAGTARLRFTVTARLDERAVDLAVEAVRGLAGCGSVSRETGGLGDG